MKITLTPTIQPEHSSLVKYPIGSVEIDSDDLNLEEIVELFKAVLVGYSYHPDLVAQIRLVGHDDVR